MPGNLLKAQAGVTDLPQVYPGISPGTGARWLRNRLLVTNKYLVQF